jgi:hypothetical protein
MPWWGWLLLAWPVMALGAAVAIGRAIRLADRRHDDRHRIGERVDDKDAD